MQIDDIWDYLNGLMCDGRMVGISLVGAFLFNFFFPTEAYFWGAIGVFCAMFIDLGTKLFSLSRRAGGFRKAFQTRIINSSSFCRGTCNKMIVFLVMLILLGLTYRLTIIPGFAMWFAQAVFVLMFLRDLLSILENLTDAGCDVGVFKKLVTKKMEEYVDGTDVYKCESTTVVKEELTHKTNNSDNPL